MLKTQSLYKLLKKHRRLIIYVLSFLLFASAVSSLYIRLCANYDDVTTNRVLSATNHVKVEPLYAPLDNLTLFEAEKQKSTVSLYHEDRMGADDMRLYHAPESALPVRMVGSVTSSDKHGDLLIIEIDNQQQDYTPGDILPGYDAVIVRIFPDRAIINRNGNYEAIIMD